MKRFSLALAVLPVLFLVSLGQAQSDDVDLNKIVVTPSRIEQYSGDVARDVDVVTSKDIERSQATDVSEVIGKFTSVNISTYGGPGASKTVTMRGSTAAQVLVMVDGRPINNPRDGQIDLNTIPLENISRIEIMHGPSSNLYGSQGMGGAINIITKEPPKEKQKTEITSSFGTRRTYVERLTHGARIANFGYLISGDYESSEGFRPNSQFNAKDFNTKFEYKLNSSNNIKLNSGFYKSKLGTPGPVTSFDADDKLGTTKNFLSFNWDFKPDADTAVSVTAYNNYDRLEFMENRQGGTPFDKSIHTTKVRGTDLQFSKRFTGFYQAICGFNYVHNLNDSTSSAKHKYTVTAGYVENQFNITQKLKMGLSARVDSYSNFGAQLNPSFNVLYKFNDDNNVHCVISRSFRAPTFNDLYYPATSMGKGNPNLKPERGATAEIGFETKPFKFLSSGITYYRSNYSQLIKWASDAANVYTPQNISKAVIHGIEFSNAVYLPFNFEFDTGYTYLRAMDDKTHKFLTYQPQHKVDFGLKYKGSNGFQAGITGQFTGLRYDNVTNTIKVKQFFVFGMNLSKKFKNGITYLFSIDNFTNRNYQVIRSYPMPGLAVTSGLKYEF